MKNLSKASMFLCGALTLTMLCACGGNAATNAASSKSAATSTPVTTSGAVSTSGAASSTISSAAGTSSAPVVTSFIIGKVTEATDTSVTIQTEAGGEFQFALPKNIDLTKLSDGKLTVGNDVTIDFTGEISPTNDTKDATVTAIADANVLTSTTSGTGTANTMP